MICVDPVPFEPPRAPAWARPSGSFREISEGEALFFAGAALSALDFVAEIGPAVGRRVPPPPRPEERRRRGAKPAQTPRGRRGAPRRGGAGQARAGARTGGTGLLGVPDAQRPGRPFSPQAPCGGRSRPAVAARSGKRGGPRRRAGGGGCARSPRPGRRRRGRSGGCGAQRDAEPLALLCADAALAKTLGWPTPLPLLASELFARRGAGEGRRPRPGEPGWERLVALAYARAALAALDLAQDLSRRAARLAEAAPKLRAKGKAGAIAALLADDAVSAAAPLPGLSDRARRRLFERLVALGAARELTGRAAFRLYGL